MPVGSSSLAAVARVAFETVGTGEVSRDIEQVERTYRASTEHMSDGALKLQLAQTRLQAALRKGPAAFKEQARAELAVRAAEQALREETGKLTRATDRQTRETQRLDRTSRAAGAGLTGLRGRVLGLGASFIGAAGLIYVFQNQLRTSIDAAKEAQVVEGQLAAALAASGIEYGRYREQIDATLRAQSRLSSFDDEELATSFTALVRATKDVALALKLNAIAAEVARGRNISLEAASNLVLKASIGQAGALRRLGIDAEKGASGLELVDLLSRRFAGSSKAYSDSAAGAQDRWNVALENAHEVIGNGLLPALTDLLNRGSEYLDQLSESGELQRKVNAAVETGEQVVRGFAGALGIVRAILRPVVNDLGGVSNAVEVLLIGGFVVKGARALQSLKLLRAALWILGPTATKSAVQVVAAEQAMGAGALAANTKALLLLRTIARIGVVALATQAIVDALLPGKQGLDFSDEAGRGSSTPVYRPGVGWVNPETGAPLSKSGGRYWDKLVAGGYYDPSTGAREKPSGQERREARQRLRGEKPATTTSTRGPGPPPSSPDATATATAVERGAERGTERGARRGLAPEAAQRKAAQEKAERSRLAEAKRADDAYRRWIARQTAEAKAIVAKEKAREKAAQAKDKPKSDGQSGLALVQEFLRLIEQYGPNYFPAASWTGDGGDGPGRMGGKGPQHRRDDRRHGARGDRGVTIEQNFMTAPTDYFREARFAQAAANAVFDG